MNNEPAVNQRWRSLFADLERLIHAAQTIQLSGRLTRASGMVLEATGLRLAVGSIVRIDGSGESAGSDDGVAIEAEVVGFSDQRLFLMPISETEGLAAGAIVRPYRRPQRRPSLAQRVHPLRRTIDRMRHLPIGDGLIGRVVDAQGQPLDDLGPLHSCDETPIAPRPVNAMKRSPIRQPLDTGVRAINALLTVGRGQRIGLFAGAGVGKSVLLGMLARFTAADVVVVGLIGERGREVKEFIEDILGASGLRRAVVVAAPADAPALLRMQAANYASAIAEFHRSRGRHVLLLMDSLTRYAMAAREIALAIGEPPATRGYPPSVFARLPRLVERAGNGDQGGGSVTAIYTVLTEGDDPNDPVADAARSILDGHVVLSRPLADAGHYPAIDIEASISRVMNAVTSNEHQQLARLVKSHWSRYQQSKDLIAIGAYQPGTDQRIDQAIAVMPSIELMLQQSETDCSRIDESLASLAACLQQAAILPTTAMPAAGERP